MGKNIFSIYNEVLLLLACSDFLKLFKKKKDSTRKHGRSYGKVIKISQLRVLKKCAKFKLKQQ